MRTSLFIATLALSVLVPTTHVVAQSAQDKAVAQEIGSQLKTSGQLRDYRIGVKYKDGVAALSGTVANREQLITAVRLTQQMGSVNQVVNNLTITGAGDSLANSASQQASRASFTGSGPQNAMATRTSYQQSGGQQPMYRQPMNGQAMYQGGMGPQGNMGPMGPRPQRPMNAGRMPNQGRGNMPRPMGRPPVQQAMAQQAMAQQQMQATQAGCNCGPGGMGGGGMGGGMMGGPPAAMGHVPGGQSGAANYDNAQMPGYAWPSYASYPNYAAVTYPKQYSPSAWPYIGPFYPYPQVPLGWRKVALEWDDGWWFLDFSDTGANH